jgi:hypothetical protein
MIFNPAWFVVSDTFIYQPSQYSYEAVGEVNNSTQIPYVLTLEGQIYSAYDETIITETAYMAFTSTLPGQPNPFYLGLGSFDDIVEKVSVQKVVPLDTIYSTATIVSKQYWYHGYGWGYITGVVRNDNVYSISSLVGIVWSLEYPTYVDITLDKTILKPGEEATFTSSIFPGTSNLSPEMFKVAVQGVISS